MVQLDARKRGGADGQVGESWDGEEGKGAAEDGFVGGEEVLVVQTSLDVVLGDDVEVLVGDLGVCVGLRCLGEDEEAVGWFAGDRGGGNLFEGAADGAVEGEDGLLEDGGALLGEAVDEEVAVCKDALLLRGGLLYLRFGCLRSSTLLMCERVLSRRRPPEDISPDIVPLCVELHTRRLP